MNQNAIKMMQIIKMLKSNPNDMISRSIENNPAMIRAKQMANGKSDDELKVIASNLCNQMGLNFNEAFNDFVKLLK